MTDEQRREIFERDGWQCKYKGCESNQIQIAHRINQGKTAARAIQNYLIANYDECLSLWQIKRDYQDHPFNVVSSCYQHNDSFNCFFKDNEFKSIIDRIYKEYNK